MLHLRKANLYDLASMQRCNTINLPENYPMRYYIYHVLSWGSLSFVAETEFDNVVGYALVKIEDEQIKKAHLTSVSVLKDYRQLGLANSLISHAHNQVKNVYRPVCICLHVRVSNAAALRLYYGLLKYKIKKRELKYYGDKEDAYVMEHTFEIAEK